MKVPYLRKPAAGDLSGVFAKEVLKPLITVVLRRQDWKAKLFSLVDSGADACLFPKGIADLLDIDVKSGHRINFMGMGAYSTPFYFREIEILLGEYRVKTKVGFSTSQNIGVSGILGQQGFFDNFIISFDHKNGFIEIKKPNFLQDITSKLPF